MKSVYLTEQFFKMLSKNKTMTYMTFKSTFFVKHLVFLVTKKLFELNLV